VKAIAAGDSHSLALMSDGTIRAWGANDLGQLGDGSTLQRSTPVKVTGSNGQGVLSGIIAIAAGGQFSLALSVQGVVFAWGANDRGQLGNQTVVGQSAIPVRVHTLTGPELTTVGIKAIAAGSAHGLALAADGFVWSWGWNNRGQLGDLTTINRSGAVLVHNKSKRLLGYVKAIAAGGALPDDGAHNLALRADGNVWGWGWNAVGQLGLGDNSERHAAEPAVLTFSKPDPSTSVQQIVPVPRVVAIAAGGWHSLVVGSDRSPLFIDYAPLVNEVIRTVGDAVRAGRT
jgi:hypothetical protein